MAKPENAVNDKPHAAGRVPSRLRCRQIAADDVDAVIALLCEGFTRQPRQHWAAAFEMLRARPIPSGAPRYGYMIESDGQAVGVLLVITTEIRQDGTTTIRSNGSSWYVRPGFRTYAGLMLTQWLRSRADLYLNVFPADHTFAIIEARGFYRFTSGISLSVPAATIRRGRVRIVDAARLSEASVPVPQEDRDLLVEHSRAGCAAFWCEAGGSGSPFVFRRRLIRSRLPCAQLIYCRRLEDLTRLAAPVGRHLLRLGLPVVLVATDGRISGIPGIYIDNKYPMYFHGTVRPRIGDLAYTEAGLFGF
jgi:hypothetical protein